MDKYTLEELIKRIYNSNTEIILKFLKTIPKIEFSRSSIQLYIYSPTPSLEDGNYSDSIMLVKSNTLQCLALEYEIHPDRFIGKTIFNMGDDEMHQVPIDTLTFHQYFTLQKDCCLSVITGQLNQLRNLLQHIR